MKTVTIIAEGYRCVGTCVTSFDGSGACIVPELPWTTEDDFQFADSMATHIHENEFYANVPVDDHVEQEIDGHEVEFLEADGVYVIYDQDTNRHYFFA